MGEKVHAAQVHDQKEQPAPKHDHQARPKVDGGGHQAAQAIDAQPAPVFPLGQSGRLALDDMAHHLEDITIDEDGRQDWNEQAEEQERHTNQETAHSLGRVKGKSEGSPQRYGGKRIGHVRFLLKDRI
jgi:hypothetical protein